MSSENKFPDIIACDLNDCNTIEAAREWMVNAQDYVMRCMNVHGNGACPSIAMPEICGSSACDIYNS